MATSYVSKPPQTSTPSKYHKSHRNPPELGYVLGKPSIIRAMGDKSEIDLRLARRGGTDSAVRSSLFAAGLHDGGADKV